MTRTGPDLLPATLAEDRDLLGPWSEAFRAVCGTDIRCEPFPSRELSQGYLLTFPRIFDPIELVGGTGHFRHNAEMVEQVQRMGFAWETDGRILTMPAAGTFNSLLQTAGLPGAGFRLAYAKGSLPQMPLGPWLRQYMDGIITLLVQAPSFYESMRDAKLPAHTLGRARWGFTSLAHDISVHALNYHLIPHAAVSDVAQRIRSALPERYAAWADPTASAPLTLTYFYDNDFNRYAYAVWSRCRRPADFADLYLAPRNYAQLVAALEIRLEETRAGRGDVASGDFNDVGQLAETHFRVG